MTPIRSASPDFAATSSLATRKNRQRGCHPHRLAASADACSHVPSANEARDHWNMPFPPTKPPDEGSRGRKAKGKDKEGVAGEGATDQGTV